MKYLNNMYSLLTLFLLATRKYARMADVLRSQQAHIEPKLTRGELCDSEDPDRYCKA